MNLECDEKILTGEAVPVAKDLDVDFSTTDELDTDVGDRLNMAYSSATVTKGRGKGVVVFTGTYTEIGKIAASMQGKHRKANRSMSRKKERKGGRGSATCEGPGINCGRGTPLTDSYLGLTTGTPLQNKSNDHSQGLASGRTSAWAQRLGLMGAEAKIPRNPSKTLVPQRRAAKHHQRRRELLILGFRSSRPSSKDFFAQQRFVILPPFALIRLKTNGRPPEIQQKSLCKYLPTDSSLGRKRLRSQQGWKQVAEYPFDSSIKRMSVIYQQENGQRAFIFAKGAIERIIELCSTIGTGANERPITPEVESGVLGQMNMLAEQGLRVMAIAQRPYTRVRRPSQAAPQPSTRAEIEKDVTLLGIAGFYDPPRLETNDAVQIFWINILTSSFPAFGLGRKKAAMRFRHVKMRERRRSKDDKMKPLLQSDQQVRLDE
ncbi:MAG: hypothetical protein Q9183_004530 [Haloplaca sp. 2 TL-2023]